jgi:hypothetical protein
VPFSDELNMIINKLQVFNIRTDFFVFSDFPNLSSFAGALLNRNEFMFIQIILKKNIQVLQNLGRFHF